MADPKIDWESLESHVLLNPRLPQSTQSSLQHAVVPYEGKASQIWLSSSGTENFPKMIALSKKAMLVSAAAVNEHLGIQKSDTWLNILPLFHTGGLAIHVRAHLSTSQVYDFSEQKWEPSKYVEGLDKHKISFSSLTPTHIFDLVTQNLLPPKHLKGIIVGGAELAHSLYEKAYNLGWPLLRSYGMTEACSQIATAPSPDSNLKLLNHMNMRFCDEGFIEIQSEALMTGFVHGNDPDRKFIIPMREGWYKTQDKGELVHGTLQLFGRGSNFIKIGCENINFSVLESIWENVKLKYGCVIDAVLIDLPDERLGRSIYLAAEDQEINLMVLIDEYNSRVLPVAKIREVFYLKALPRTELFKLKKHELRSFLINLTHRPSLQ